MKLRHPFTALAPAVLVMTFAATSALAQNAPAPTNTDRTPATQTERGKSDTTTNTNKTAPNSSATGAANSAPNSAASRGTTGAALSDGQILQVVKTLNDAEIKQANEAIDESKSADIKALAEMIKADHEAANDQIDGLLKGDLDLDDSALNKTLAKENEATHERLQDLDGAQYDCAYVQQQVAEHQSAIDLSKTQLSVNAKDPAIKTFLTGLAPKLQHHQEMAQASLGKLQGCKAPAAVSKK